MWYRYFRCWKHYIQRIYNVLLIWTGRYYRIHIENNTRFDVVKTRKVRGWKSEVHCFHASLRYGLIQLGKYWSHNFRSAVPRVHNYPEIMSFLSQSLVVTACVMRGNHLWLALTVYNGCRCFRMKLLAFSFKEISLLQCRSVFFLFYTWLLVKYMWVLWNIQLSSSEKYCLRETQFFIYL